MKFRNATQVRVDQEKITEYLLCTSHPDGRSKAEFFRSFGFRMENWEVLAEALRKHGATHSIVKVVESAYGTRYSVDGTLETPDRRNPRVRTVWILEEGALAPRLIRAHPV